MKRLIFALSLLPSAASAATLTVPADHPTLEAAVAAAAANDTIVLASGTYDVEMDIPIPLKIHGADGAVVILQNTTGTSGQIFNILPSMGIFELKDVFIAPSGDNRAITATDVDRIEIKNVSASGLTTTGSGAFLKAVNADVITFTNSEVYGSTAGLDGGALHISRADPMTSTNLRVLDSTFETGTAGGDGGLVWAGDSNLTIRDSIIGDGFAVNGGGVYLTTTEVPNATPRRTLSIRTSVIADNEAEEVGGGLFLFGLAGAISGSSISRNTASAAGGVYVDQGFRDNDQITFENVTLFQDNEAHAGGTSSLSVQGIGAAAYVVADSLSVDETTLEGNLGTAGALKFEGSSADLNRVTATLNVASGDGAALHLSATEDVLLDNSVITENTAGADGGGLFADSPSIVLQRTEITLNTAGGTGGGAHLLTSDDMATTLLLELDTLDVTDNAAAEGGGLYRSGTAADTTVVDSRFYRNQATIDGGALNASGVGELMLMRNHWCENSAGPTGRGGATLFVGTGNSAVVSNESANDNSADTGAVFALTDFLDLNLTYTTFADNTAASGSLVDAIDVVDPSVIDNVAATGTSGSLFASADGASPAGMVTISDLATADNPGATAEGAWASTTVLDPVVLDTTYLYNNHPAPSCEDTRLYPHARTREDADNDPTTGSLRADAGSLVPDIGMSGGPDADINLRRDADGDLAWRIDDCGDDDERTSNPGATDVCDGIDNDCDDGGPDVTPGVDADVDGIDEDPNTLWFLDTDADTFGDPDAQFELPACDAPTPQHVDNSGDCDDTRMAVNPLADEICDTLDNDCDGTTDVGASDALTFFADLDFDGFGNPNDTRMACELAAGFTTDDGDCDDTLANVYPGAVERCDLLDNDCDGRTDIDAIDAPTWYPDGDLDGFGIEGHEVVSCLPPLDHSPYAGDCIDDDFDINPGAAEVCDGEDNDCDGTTDVDPISPLYYLDVDGDGFGDNNTDPIGSCTAIVGRILDDGDCNDGNPDVYRGAPESCNDIDDDCDGSVDDNPTNGNVYFQDADLDGFGNDAFIIRACSVPPRATETGGDCNDQNGNQFPGNDEQCDQVDNDCDGTIDEPDAIDAVVWYPDVDDDSFGDESLPRTACNPPIGHVPTAGDCDDNNPISFPNSPEVCDGVDNDCNGQVDGADAADVSFYYADADGDGFGDPASELGACFIPEGYVTNDNDCDDTNPNANPQALEIAGNDIDENCDGQDLPGEPTPPTDPPVGCEGCSSNGSGAPLFLAPMLAGLFLRRRRS